MNTPILALEAWQYGLFGIVALVALVALRAWRVLNGVYCELERAMRQPIVPKGDVFANIVRCMALVDENSSTTIFQKVSKGFTTSSNRTENPGSFPCSDACPPPAHG